MSKETIGRGFKALSENAIIPKRATSNSAGYDFYVPKNLGVLRIEPKETVIFPTDIAAYMEHDEYLAIFIRSSLGIKKHLKITNQVGIIDSDYFNNADNHGNIHMAIENTGIETVEISSGERIAQGVFMKYLTISNEEENTNVRTSGIGSSGK